MGDAAGSAGSAGAAGAAAGGERKGQQSRWRRRVAEGKLDQEFIRYPTLAAEIFKATAGPTDKYYLASPRTARINSVTPLILQYFPDVAEVKAYQALLNACRADEKNCAAPELLAAKRAMDERILRLTDEQVALLQALRTGENRRRYWSRRRRGLYKTAEHRALGLPVGVVPTLQCINAGGRPVYISTDHTRAKCAVKPSSSVIGPITSPATSALRWYRANGLVIPDDICSRFGATDITDADGALIGCRGGGGQYERLSEGRLAARKELKNTPEFKAAYSALRARLDEERKAARAAQGTARAQVATALGLSAYDNWGDDEYDGSDYENDEYDNYGESDDYDGGYGSDFDEYDGSMGYYGRSSGGYSPRRSSY